MLFPAWFPRRLVKPHISSGTYFLWGPLKSPGRVVSLELIYLVGGFKHEFYVPQCMGCHPSHWLSYFSRWLKHVKTTNQYKYYILLYHWSFSPLITACYPDFFIAVGKRDNGEDYLHCSSSEHQSLVDQTLNVRWFHQVRMDLNSSVHI